MVSEKHLEPAALSVPPDRWVPRIVPPSDPGTTPPAPAEPWRRDETRPTGYYWIVFDYAAIGKTGAPPLYWEPASWDASFHAWVLLGTQRACYSWQLDRLGPPLDEPPAPIARRPDPQP